MVSGANWDFISPVTIRYDSYPMRTRKIVCTCEQYEEMHVHRHMHFWPVMLEIRRSGDCGRRSP